MYIRKTKRTYKGKTYTNQLLVESVQTPKGPRQRSICSLGSLEPAPPQDWLALAHKLQFALQRQVWLPPVAEALQSLSDKARRGNQRAAASPSALEIDADRVRVEQARQAGAVHVGQQIWRQLGLELILERAGLSERARRLSEAMTLNRLICPLSEHRSVRQGANS